MTLFQGSRGPLQETGTSYDVGVRHDSSHLNFSIGEKPPLARAALLPDAEKKLPELRAQLNQEAETGCRTGVIDVRFAAAAAQQILADFVWPEKEVFSKEELPNGIVQLNRIGEACHLPLGEFYCITYLESDRRETIVNNALILEPTWQAIHYLDRFDVWTADCLYLDSHKTTIGHTSFDLVFYDRRKADSDARDNVRKYRDVGKFGNFFFKEFSEASDRFCFPEGNYVSGSGVMRGHFEQLQKALDMAAGFALSGRERPGYFDNFLHETVAVMRDTSSIRRVVTETEEHERKLMVAQLSRNLSGSIAATIREMNYHLDLSFPEFAYLAGLEFFGLHLMPEYMHQMPHFGDVIHHLSGVQQLAVWDGMQELGFNSPWDVHNYVLNRDNVDQAADRIKGLFEALYKVHFLSDQERIERLSILEGVRE